MVESQQSRHLDKQIDKRLKQFPKVDKPKTEQLYYYEDLSNVEKLMYHERATRKPKQKTNTNNIEL